VPDSFETEDRLDIEETPENDLSGVKHEETGVGSRPGEGDPDRDRACSWPMVVFGVPGSITIAGREMRSLVGVVGSERIMNTAPLAE